MTERELLDALARDVADLLAHAERITEHARPVADSHQPGADSHQQQATIPPADADDAGARLVAWLVESDAPVLVDLARVVIRQRDEARRALDVSQSTLRDALAREVDATARADAAEATVRELRALCEEAAKVMEHDTLWGLWGGVQGQSIDDAEWKSARAMYNRLRAAAVQPASEGRADA